VTTDTVMADSDVGRPVRVRWIDSGLAVHGWNTFEELPASVEEVETVGLWMGENDDCIMIGSTRDSKANSWLGAQLIWKDAICKKEWL
jgi:hypothetical protein